MTEEQHAALLAVVEKGFLEIAASVRSGFEMLAMEMPHRTYEREIEKGLGEIAYKLDSGVGYMTGQIVDQMKRMGRGW